MHPASDSYHHNFPIRTFYYGDLAQLYFPTITRKSATQAFRRMVRAHKELVQLMQEGGYKSGGRILSPRIVESVVKCLGEPL